MRSLLKFIKESWGFLVFVLAMNVLVTNCVFDVRKETSAGDHTKKINKYYLDKICSKVACNENMPSVCQEYCYNKEVLGK